MEGNTHSSAFLTIPVAWYLGKVLSEVVSAIADESWILSTDLYSYLGTGILSTSGCHQPELYKLPRLEGSFGHLLSVQQFSPTTVLSLRGFNLVAYYPSPWLVLVHLVAGAAGDCAIVENHWGVWALLRH
jgi:hypothetical protein